MLGEWNWGDWLKLVHLAASVIGIAVTVALYLRTRSTKVIDDLKRALSDGDSDLRTALEGHASEVATTLRDHGHRLSVLETTVRHMPRHNDLIDIRRELSVLNGTVAAIEERSESTLEMVRSIQQHLMESK